MGLATGIEIISLTSTKGGNIEFFAPQQSDETMLVQIPGNTVDHLFVHRFQTDQLFVAKGSLVLVTLQNRRYHYTLLAEQEPMIVKIPPGVPHGAINLRPEPCLIVNAVLRHGAIHERDYRPLQKPFPYDMERVEQLVTRNSIKEYV
jgi:uncharacterized RmlC-like cupin family protein